MGIIEWAISPWGQTVPIHIGWFLIWVAAIAGLLFLTVHAIYARYFAGTKEFAADAPGFAARLPEQIPRHSLAARLFHWIMAAAMLTLLFTAFLPKVGLQFDWVTYHWIAGIVLTVSIVFHVVHASFWLDFWSIWPDRVDLRDAGRRALRFMGRPAPAPQKFAKYPLDNKLYHLAIVVTGLSVILTGVFMLFRVRTIFFARDPYLFRRHDVGTHVRAARAGRRRPDRVGHDSRLLCHSTREARHHEVDDLRFNEPGILSEGT